MPDPHALPADPRPILTAVLLSVGSELTVGDTRDTNAGELARALTARGVEVVRLTAVRDRLDDVRAAFDDGLDRADLVVSTGGLGPTPDDLTREAIAAVCGETPEVDPALEAWLRELWRRRNLPFPELNRKQAWLIPSAVSLPNPNGTAPGWFVRRPTGGVIVALPGPPREMRPMWSDHALPRLEAAGLGRDVASRTYRLTGHFVGDPQVYRDKDALKEELETKDPIRLLGARLEIGDAAFAAIDAEVTAEVEAAVEFAKAGTDPAPEDALKYVYA
jgi:nicotinamide-nucleotide amidase